MNRFFLERPAFSRMLGAPDRRPRCHDRPRIHLLVLLSDDGRPFFARRDACGRHFVHGAGGAFVFPARLAPQERHVPAAGLPAFLGGGNLASGQAADDGGTAVSASGRHSGVRAAASCGGCPVAEARGEGFACSGAGAQPRVFRLRAASVPAGRAGPFPPAAGRTTFCRGRAPTDWRFFFWPGGEAIVRRGC